MHQNQLGDKKKKKKTQRMKAMENKIEVVTMTKIQHKLMADTKHGEVITGGHE